MFPFGVSGLTATEGCGGVPVHELRSPGGRVAVGRRDWPPVAADADAPRSPATAPWC